MTFAGSPTINSNISLILTKYSYLYATFVILPFCIRHAVNSITCKRFTTECLSLSDVLFWFKTGVDLVLVARQTSGQITSGLHLGPRHNKSIIRIINVFFSFLSFFFRGKIRGQRGRLVVLVCADPTEATQIRKSLTDLDKTVEIWKELSKADEIVTNLIMQ